MHRPYTVTGYESLIFHLRPVHIIYIIPSTNLTTVNNVDFELELAKRDVINDVEISPEMAATVLTSAVQRHVSNGKFQSLSVEQRTAHKSTLVRITT